MIEQFYENPRELVKEIDDFSGNKLSARDDLQRLFDVSLNEKNEKLFEETVFTAKYVLGLMRVMKKGTSNPEIESLDHVKKDLTVNMEKVVGQIRDLVSESNEVDKDYFEENFLQMNPEAFQNLNKLLEDLEWTKKFMNVLKRS